MQNELSGACGCAGSVNPAAAERLDPPTAEGQEEVEGFFDVVRLGPPGLPKEPPVCLPVLPKYPPARPVFEPLGDPRGRELLP